MFKKLIVVDGKGHLLGRLASYVAKEALNGQRVTIVRSEKVLISGSKYRNKLKFMDAKNKKMSSNPRKGPFHYKSPAAILLKKIRGMLPHKTSLGQAALGRIKTFDGVPLTYNSKKKVVIRDALKVVRLKPRSRFCNLGEVATTCGWTKGAIINSFEAKRAGKNREWHLKRVKALKERKEKLEKVQELKKINTELAELGY